MMAAASPFYDRRPMGTSGRLDHTALRDEHSTTYNAEHNTTISDELQAKHDIVHNLVEAVHYKPCTYQ